MILCDMNYHDTTLECTAYFCSCFTVSSTGQCRLTFQLFRAISICKCTDNKMLACTVLHVIVVLNLRLTLWVCVTCSRAMHLQKRLEELKERELTAQQHNRQLLQQFEEAQDTLRTMLTLTTAMKTIRVNRHKNLAVTLTHLRHLLYSLFHKALVLNLFLDL